jgi:CubicO group peptidase (beta-lactamase class C family)
MPGPVRVALLASLGIGLFSAVPVAAADSSEEISRLLAAVRAAHQVPALVASVGHADGSIQTGAVGVRVLGKPQPVTPDDEFHIGSVTKPMTATVIATLVEEGQLQWSTTIAQALPECSSTLRPEYRDVTVADLLAHEGGLPAFDDEKDLKAIPPSTSRLAFSCLALSRPPVVRPKKEFSYSNAGFSVVAAIAEKASGLSWEELMKTRVFTPLGLATAGFGWPAKGGAPQPWGHWKRFWRVVPQDPDGKYQLPAYLAPAGDVHMSMPDLARFLAAHLRALHGDSQLVKPETARLMHTRRIKSGLGWGVQPLAGFDAVSVYQGSADTFITIVAIVHDADLVIAVSANSATKEADAATKQALKTLLARYGGKEG